MKRVSQGGTSPGPKYPYFCENESDLSSEELNFQLQSQSKSNPSENLEFGDNLLVLSQGSSSHPLSQHQFQNFPDLFQRDRTSDSGDETSSEMDLNLVSKDWLDNNSSNSS